MAPVRMLLLTLFLALLSGAAAASPDLWLAEGWKTDFA